MALTATQRKRLAEEARRLAYECAEGTAPALGTGMFVNGDGPVCALGHVGWRFGWRQMQDFDPLWIDYNAETHIAVNANDVHHELAALRHERSVFPLLALADALEAA